MSSTEEFADKSVMEGRKSVLSECLFARYCRSGLRPGTESEVDEMHSSRGTSLPFRTYSSPGCIVGSTGSECEFADQSVALLIGTPYWDSPHLQKLSAESGHSQTLAKAYSDEGIECLSNIRGSFSFFIADNEKGICFAGVDRLGRFPLYYTIMDSELVLATHAAAVFANSDRTREITNQGIYDYLYFHMIPSPGSIFRNLSKLQAAHCLQFEAGNVSVRRYWTPDFVSRRSDNFADLRDQFGLALRNSIKRAVPADENVASFLSGGLDSSTVTGLLSEISETSSNAYSIGFEAEGYDEMAYARITATHFGVNLHEHYVTPDDVVEALPLIAASYDEPFGNSSALPAWFCAKYAAQDGVDRLLAGDGGDELFAGNERYGAQHVFEVYSFIPPPFRKLLIEPIVNRLPNGFPLGSKAKAYLRQANMRLPGRLQYYNFLNQHDPSEIFCDRFLSEVDTEVPRLLQEQIYTSPEEATSLDRMLYLDWQITLADNDLRKVSHTAALAGIHVSYPLLDDELVDMSCRIADSLKLKRNELRYFFKEALRGWLPEQTLSKEKHGFGLPFGVWMRTHSPLQDLAYQALTELKKRGYFSTQFIDSTIRLHREGHASYYGELIWILVIFELWMNHRDQVETARRSRSPETAIV